MNQVERVDVLAVLGALNLADPGQRPELARARAAVAELVAKAEAAAGFSFCRDIPLPMWEQLPVEVTAAAERLSEVRDAIRAALRPFNGSDKA